MSTILATARSRARASLPTTDREWWLAGLIGPGGAIVTVIALLLLQAFATAQVGARLLDGGQAFGGALWLIGFGLAAMALGCIPRGEWSQLIGCWVMGLLFLGIFSIGLEWGFTPFGAMFGLGVAAISVRFLVNLGLVASWLVGYALLWGLGVLMGGMPFWAFALAWSALAILALRLARVDRGVAGRSLRGIVPGAPLDPWDPHAASSALARRLDRDSEALQHGRIASTTINLVSSLVVQAHEIVISQRDSLPGSPSEYASEQVLSYLLKTWHAKGRLKRLAPSEMAELTEVLAIAVAASQPLDRAEDRAVFRAVLKGLLDAWYADQPTFQHP